MRTSRGYLINNTNEDAPNMQIICVSESKGLYGNEEKILHSAWELWHLILAVGDHERSLPENIKNCTQACKNGFHISSHKFVSWQRITAPSSYIDKHSSWWPTLAILRLWTKIILIHQPNKRKLKTTMKKSTSTKGMKSTDWMERIKLRYHYTALFYRHVTFDLIIAQK